MPGGCPLALPNHHYLNSKPLGRFPFGESFLPGVHAPRKNLWAQLLQNRGKGKAVKANDIVHNVNGAKKSHPVILAKMRVSALVPIDRSLGIHPHNQPIPKLFGTLKVLKVPDVKDIKTTAGGYQALSLACRSKVG